MPFILFVTRFAIFESGLYTLRPRADTVLPAKSDVDFMFCLQSYQGFIIDRSLVY